MNFNLAIKESDRDFPIAWLGRRAAGVESIYCSHGDTVHYATEPVFFETCEGSYLYDQSRHAVSGSSDVVLSRQFRLPQPAPQRRSAPATRHAASGRLAISSSREGRACHAYRA